MNWSHTILINNTRLILSFLPEATHIALVTSDAKLRPKRRSTIISTIVEWAIEQCRVRYRAAHSHRRITTCRMGEGSAMHHLMNQGLSNLVRSLREQHIEVYPDLITTDNCTCIDTWSSFDAVSYSTSICLYKISTLLSLEITASTSAVNSKASWCLA